MAYDAHTTDDPYARVIEGKGQDIAKRLAWIHRQAREILNDLPGYDDPDEIFEYNLKEFMTIGDLPVAMRVSITDEHGAIVNVIIGQDRLTSENSPFRGKDPVPLRPEYQPEVTRKPGPWESTRTIPEDPLFLVRSGVHRPAAKAPGRHEPQKAFDAYARIMEADAALANVFKSFGGKVKIFSGDAAALAVENPKIALTAAAMAAAASIMAVNISSQNQFDIGGSDYYVPPVAAATIDVPLHTPTTSEFKNVGGLVERTIDSLALKAETGRDSHTFDLLGPGISDQDIIEHIVEAEGDVPFMYLDTRNHVTIGRGHMFDRNEAPSLPFKIRDENGHVRNATRQEIILGFNRVASFRNCNCTANFFNPETNNGVSNLFLDDRDVYRLVKEDLNEALHHVRNDFPDLDTYPAQIRLALLDMQFNMGASRFNERKWPNFYRAVENRDWDRAASLSRRRGIGEERNRDMRDLIMQAHRGQPIQLG